MKKILVPFDENKPGKQFRDYIYPEVLSNDVYFVGISKPKRWTKGMVVYTGKEITANDVFARIVDSGKKINSVDSLFNNLQNYIDQLSGFSIGNIVEIEADPVNGFMLKKSEDRPISGAVSKIP